MAKQTIQISQEHIDALMALDEESKRQYDARQAFEIKAKQVWHAIEQAYNLRGKALRWNPEGKCVEIIKDEEDEVAEELRKLKAGKGQFYTGAPQGVPMPKLALKKPSLW